MNFDFFEKTFVYLRLTFAFKTKLMKKALFFALFGLCFSPSAIGQFDDKKVYQNETFQPYVKTIRLFPVTENPGQNMKTPVVPLSQSDKLLLHFDLLMDEYTDLQAKIIHCNADWTKSVLNDIEFLYDYNTFDIRDFEYSENTKELFVYYWLYMPRLKRTGNYIVQVYNYGNEEEVLLTRRFVAYQQLTSVDSKTGISSSVRGRNFNQQIEFTIGYPRLDVVSPLTDIKVMVRQNGRWDNAIDDLKPTAIRMDQRRLEYFHFNDENNFFGGNEFRFFDLRTYTVAGINVARMDYHADPMQAELVQDKSRNGLSYTITPDMNGNYFISTLETGASYLEADYINVKFSIRSKKLEQDVYVVGEFNDWQRNDLNRMIYDPVAQAYVCTIKMKQGYYNYTYYVDGNPYALDGSHYQARNDYDIIIYHRSMGSLTDDVVGYSFFQTEW